jgi:nitroreductase
MQHSLRTCVVLLAAALATPSAFSAELSPITLPPPQTDGGVPLMQALKLRATSRAFAPGPLPPQTLSNLLWAAFGVNRPAQGMRTAPSAHNRQEIDVVVLLPTGAYVYDAKAHALQPLAPGDLRALGGTQDFVKDAPVTLVFVADASRMGDGADAREMAWADAGFVSQNVYLFCASEGLATGVRASIDRAALAKALALRDDQLVLLAQCVGFPRKEAPEGP